MSKSSLGRTLQWTAAAIAIRLTVIVQQVPYGRGDVFRRLSGANAGIDAGRQVYFVAGQQNNKNPWAHRPDTARHVKPGVLPQIIVEHNGSNGANKKQQRDGVCHATGTYDFVTSGPQRVFD